MVFVLRKTVVSILTILVLGWSFFLPAQVAFASTSLKTINIWNRPLTYRLIKINNPTLSYDGAAYVQTDSEGNRENRVILNTAYLEKEAAQIWESFAIGRRSEMDKPVTVDDVLAKLTLVRHGNQLGKGMSSSEKKWLIGELEKIESELEYSAWYPFYERARREALSDAEARGHFLSEFSRIRRRTIEYHELSHLLDEQWIFEGTRKGDPDRHRQKLLSQTEVRAFLTELAYGTNPHDTLWQVVSGVIDELKRGKNVDDSVQKLVAVLDFSKTTFARSGKSSLLCLCRISRAQSKSMAWSLFPLYRIAGVLDKPDSSG